MSTEKMHCPDLCLFGDGGNGGATGAAAAPAADRGDAAFENSGAEAGTGAESGRDADGREESFDSLVKGRFKEDYDKSVRDIVTRRLKSEKQARERAERFLPIIRALGEKYGIDTSDPDSVNVQSLQERISGKGEAAAGQGEKDEGFLRLIQEGRELVGQYPSFSIEEELANPEFSRMVWAGVPMKTAYEAVHKDRILAGAVKYTADRVREMISQSIQAGAGRPDENGVRAHSAAVAGPDLSSKSYRERIKERVRRGEKVFL